MKVCFVGVGSIGKRHIHNLSLIAQEDGIDLKIHALRTKKDTYDTFSKDYIECEFYNISEMDESYDAVFVTNPTFLHYETINKLKNKSKCFFIEKPVFDKCDLDYNNIIIKDNIYYVACPLRYTGIVRYAKEIIDPKNVINIRAMCSSYLPDWRPGVDYRNVYSAHKDQGGGVEIDLIHEWDYITYLFGMPNKVDKICRKYSSLEIDSNDLAVYIADFGYMTAELHLDYFGRSARRYFEILTNDNFYVFDFINNKIEKNGEILKSIKEESNDKYIYEMRFFLNVMKYKEDNTNSIEHALDVMKIAI